jgi:hypothetical protein
MPVTFFARELIPALAMPGNNASNSGFLRVVRGSAPKPAAQPTQSVSSPKAELQNASFFDRAHERNAQ